MDVELSRANTSNPNALLSPPLILLGRSDSDADPFSLFFVLNRDLVTLEYAVAGVGFRNQFGPATGLIPNGGAQLLFRTLRSLTTLGTPTNRLHVAADRQGTGLIGTTYYSSYATIGDMLQPFSVGTGTIYTEDVPDTPTRWEALPFLTNSGGNNVVQVAAILPATPPELYLVDASGSNSLGRAFASATPAGSIEVAAGQDHNGAARALLFSREPMNGGWQMVAEGETFGINSPTLPPLAPPPMADGLHRPAVLVAGDRASILFMVGPSGGGMGTSCASGELKAFAFVIFHPAGGTVAASPIPAAEVCTRTTNPYFHVSYPTDVQNGTALVTLTDTINLTAWTVDLSAALSADSVSPPQSFDCGAPPAMGFHGTSRNLVLCHRLDPLTGGKHDRIVCELAARMMP